MEQYDKQDGIFNLEVDSFAKNTLLEMGRWTKFLGIMGFVCMGLMLLFGITMCALIPTLLDKLGGGGQAASVGLIVVIIITIIGVGVSFYPSFALVKYSANIKRSVETQNITLFNDALSSLKNIFKYVAIVTIVYFGLLLVDVVFQVMRAM